RVDGADDVYGGGLAGEHTGAESFRHDYPGPQVAVGHPSTEGVGVVEPLDLDDAICRQRLHRFAEPCGDFAAVLVDEADRGDRVVPERPAEDDAEDVGQHQRGDDAEDERRAIPQAQPQVFGRDPPGSSHQSRNAFPVRWRNTASRSGSWISTPVTVIPEAPAAASKEGSTDEASRAR